MVNIPKLTAAQRDCRHVWHHDDVALAEGSASRRSTCATRQTLSGGGWYSAVARTLAPASTRRRGWRAAPDEGTGEAGRQPGKPYSRRVGAVLCADGRSAGRTGYLCSATVAGAMG